MKNIFQILTIFVASLCTHSGYCQNPNVTINTETRKVLYYQVEETVNQNFGGTKTSYTVSDLSLIDDADLGPNNIRTITPIYKKENFTDKEYARNITAKTRETNVKKRVEEPSSIQIEGKETTDIVDPEIEKIALKLAIENFKKEEAKEIAKSDPNRLKPDHIYINIIDIYERVAEKGYKSVYLFTLLSDSFYYNKEIEKAAKYYQELFKMTTNLAPEYYFRYGDALLKTGQTAKGKEMIEKFYQLTE
ncbi:tetratricopeptide repeat protein [Flavobacterium faecale]|uniref:tetratricopeptide repeat protein n=1 Tax=Flavobacterium faecale TaxID=1355330 RepID=UPI003AB022B6